MSIQPTPIIVVPKDTEQTTLTELRKGGWIPILADSAKVVTIAPTAFLESGDMLMAALQSITGPTALEATRSSFVSNLFTRMRDNEKLSKPTP